MGHGRITAGKFFRVGHGRELALRLGVVGSAVMVLGLAAGPVHAGVAGEGDGGLIINTVLQTVNVDDVAEVTEQVVVENTVIVVGVGRVSGNGVDQTFNRDLTVAGSDSAAAIAQILAALTADVNAVPGTTASHTSDTTATGSTTVVLSSDTVDSLDGTTTTGETTTTVDVSPDAIVIGDLSGDPFLLTILAGTVTVTNTSTDTTTNFITRTTTESVGVTDSYLVEVDRVLETPEPTTTTITEPTTTIPVVSQAPAPTIPATTTLVASQATATTIATLPRAGGSVSLLVVVAIAMLGIGALVQGLVRRPRLD